MSDRAIGHVAGLAAKTVAAIRKRSTEGSAPSNTRVGRDGRVRRLDSSEARRHAAQLLTRQPTASLREVARAVGISPATVRDVRERLERGEPPVLTKSVTVYAGTTVGAFLPEQDCPAQPAQPAQRPADAADPAATVQKLLRDPSLRNNEQGKGMLRLLHVNAVGAHQLPDVASTVPAHCVTVVGRLARCYADMWLEFARELDSRARIIDPAAATR